MFELDLAEAGGEAPSCASQGQQSPRGTGAPITVWRCPGARTSPPFSHRYKLAVTRRKEEEPTSTSVYNQNDPWTPTVVFADFIDNETITNEVRGAGHRGCCAWPGWGLTCPSQTGWEWGWGPGWEGPVQPDGVLCVTRTWSPGFLWGSCTSPTPRTSPTR